MASVSIRHAQKRYGAVEVIPGIDLDIADREFVTLVGPSGCGKSTLLRMIAGLEGISDGQIFIGDECVNDVPPMHRDVAMVFQSYALYPHMTVTGNMSFGLRLRRIAADRIRSLVEGAAQTLNLVPLLDRMPRQLSGGQRQRVAMGRAIVRNPRLFLFDEPLSNLDAQLRVQMRTEIKSLHRRLGSTSIYVTHDQIEAMTMADRIVVMNGGRIAQQGSPEELYDRPANLFVAGFIGSPAMNFITGTIDPQGRFLLQDGRAAGATPLAGMAGRRLVLGVRPEHVVLTGEDAGTLAASIAEVEPTGIDTHVVCDLAEQQVTVSVRDRVRAEPGTPVRLAFQPDRVHWFDPETGMSIRQTTLQ
jgi:multiple sugar transport system ATP-binding protein